MKLKPSTNPGIKRRTAAASAALANLQLKTILATTDFSPESLAGVRYAVALAERLGAAVALLHIIERRTWLSELGSIVPVREDSEVVASARAQLTALAKRDKKSGVAVTCSVFVRAGNPFHTITTAAHEHEAELIVIATHGRTGAERVLLGSTAERVVRHAPCPVLTVPTRTQSKRTGKTPPFKLRKILVPIDFSGISKDALPWATFLAARFGAELILLHVVEKFPIDYLLGSGLTNETLVPFMEQAEAGLERMAASLSKATDARTSAIVRQGTPFAEICHAAKTLGADIIVLTTHGYTGLKHAWLGSTAERVVRHAPCPVLTVRPPAS
jgi:nucleotide-binding universal stress UspA family protein